MGRCGNRRVTSIAAFALVALAVRSVGAQQSSAPPSVAASSDHPPRLVYPVEAAYPPEALRAGRGAVVRLNIDVDDGGRVTSVSIAESSGEADFDLAAMVAAREFDFEPARRGGLAVAARIRYRYTFTPPPVHAAADDAPRHPIATTGPPLASSGPAASGSPSPRESSAPPTEQGVTVYAHAPTREVVQHELTAEDIRRIPGARGDALLAVMNLPGVARPQFGLGQFSIRSSPPEDTLVLLEGQPIALPFHFEGLASTVSTEMIDRVAYIPGNFSVRYGRAAGGVIDVTLRSPDRTRARAIVDVDVIDGGVFASTPLGEHAAAAVGLRRSFIDLVGPAFFSAAGGISFREWPQFWDAQAMVDWDIGAHDTLRTVFAMSDDQLLLNFADPDANDPHLRGNLGTHLSYYGLQERWRHTFAPGVINTFAPSLAYNLSAGSLGSSVSFDFRSVVASIRDEFEVDVTRQVRMFLGTDIQTGYLWNNVTAPPLPLNGIQDPIDTNSLVTYASQNPFFSPGFYAEAEVDATSNIRLLTGVRVDSYSLLHGATTVDPRATVRFTLVPRIVLRAGFGEFSTPPRGYYIVPGFGNPDLVPEHWLHVTVGAQIEIIPGIAFLDTDVFVKLGDDVVMPTAAMRTDANGQSVPANFSNDGTGRVIGGEWMLRIRPGRSSPVYALISYTYQRATRSACPGCPYVTYTYDQPHIFSAVLSAILPYGLEAGIRVRYTSGIVTPNVTGGVYDADQDIALTLADPLNPSRLPPFFSLDARVSKRFTLGPIHGQAVIEVLNATNNNNAESVIYSYDRRTYQYVYGLPIIPSLGIRAEY